MKIDDESKMKQAAKDLEKAYTNWWAQGTRLLLTSTVLSNFSPEAARIYERMRKHLPDVSKEAEQKSGGVEA